MRHIRKFNESNQDKLSKFHKEYEELCKDEDLGNHELWTEIGQLTLKYDLTKDDVLFILNNFNCKFDVNGFLKQTWSDWDDNLEDVRRSFNEMDMEKSFKEGYNLALHHFKEYLSKDIVGYDFLKDEPKDFYTFIKNYV